MLTYHGATAGTFLALGPQTIAWFYVVLEEIKTCVFCDTHFEIPSYWCRSTKRRNITPLPHPTPAFPFNVMAFPINVMAFTINVMAFPIHGMAPGLAAAPGHGQISKWKCPVNGNAIWGRVGGVGWGGD